MIAVGGTGGVVGIAGAAPASAGESIAPPQERWNQTYGGESIDYASAAVATNDGGYLLAGQTASAGAGSSDAWLVKVDDDGEEEWNRTYGGTGYDVATALVETEAGYLLAGHTSSSGAGFWDAWLVKVDDSGEAVWNRTYGGADRDLAAALVETEAGYLLAGQTASAGAGGSDAWLVKVDDTGREAWNRTYGGAGYDGAAALVATGDGYLLAGETTSAGAGSSDAWLVKVDGSGEEVWTRTYGGAGYDLAAAAVATSDGGYLLAGETTSAGAGSSDAWLVKVDGTGEEAWNRTYGGAGYDGASAVTETSGGYLVAGRMDGPGGSDGWAAAVTDAGEEAWNRTYGGAGYDASAALAPTTDGGYLLAGQTASFGVDGIDAWALELGAATVAVDVDVKPGSDSNAINPASQGVVPVTIYNTSGVDPAAVDVRTLRLGVPDGTDGGAVSARSGHRRDVDDDGDADLVVYFRVAAVGLDAGDARLRLDGRLLNGTPIEGADDVRTVGRASNARA
jgi:hypothetical protein